jgi:hypothetical protein
MPPVLPLSSGSLGGRREGLFSLPEEEEEDETKKSNVFIVLEETRVLVL